MAIKIIEEACTGCHICFWICPSDVIRMDERQQKALAVYNTDCSSCRLCEENCPFGAVMVVPRKVAKGTETFALNNYLRGLGIDPGTL